MNHRLFSRIVKIWSKSGKVLQRISRPQDLKPSLKIDDRLVNRVRYLLANLNNYKMSDSATECHSSITPPETVKGMMQLNREAFRTVAKIPALKIPKKDLGSKQKVWKSLQLKIRGLKPVGDLGDKDPDRDTHGLIFLDPDKLKADSLSGAQTDFLLDHGLDMENPQTYEVDLFYDNWSVGQVLRAVLPSDADNVTSFTQIGHIAHLNLKPENLPFKILIGEVILDKIPSVKTVVNKLNAIDNTYRNFQMELLAGEDNFITQTKEHNCVFELDFSKVYWNSRLSTEHHRIVDLVERGSVVFDVFAGIGPFTVPLAKKKQCTVFANDLNPSSFQYLKKNITLNKIKEDRVSSFNLDGRDFIRTIVKNDLTERVKIDCESPFSEANNSGKMSSVGSDLEIKSQNISALSSYEERTESEKNRSTASSYVIMNLPALAVDFLDTFNGLLSDLPQYLNSSESLQKFLPHVYCYTFCAKSEMEKELRDRVERALGQAVPDSFQVRLVRNVAPNKEMMCVSFKLWPQLVLEGSKDQENKVDTSPDANSCSEPEAKKQKVVT